MWFDRTPFDSVGADELAVNRRMDSQEPRREPVLTCRRSFSRGCIARSDARLRGAPARRLAPGSRPSIRRLSTGAMMLGAASEPRASLALRNAFKAALQGSGAG
jgi:hypothetical protein